MPRLLNIDAVLTNADWPKRTNDRLSAYGLKTLGDVQGHEFHGNQWTTIGSSGGEARVFHTPADVKESRSGWAGDPVRYEWKDKPGQLVAGNVMARESLPDTLYHVTTNTPAVAESGLLLGQHSDAGLGGGTESGVSMTSDRTSAEIIQRELTRSVRIARGEDTIDDLARYAREDEKTGDLKPGQLDAAVAEPKRGYDVNSHLLTRTWKDDVGWVEKPPPPEEQERIRRSITKDAFNMYLQMREGHRSNNSPKLINPILFGNQESLKRINPDHIRTLVVPTANIPAKALITSGSDAFLHEVRVYADVPVHGMRHNEVRIAGDVEGHPFHGNQWTGVHELGQVGSSGAVQTRRISKKELGITQHGDVLGKLVRPEQRFRFTEGEVQWNELPTKEDYFKVDDHYARRGPVTHTVFDGDVNFRRFNPETLKDLADFDESKHPRDEKGRWSDTDVEAAHQQLQAESQVGIDNVERLLTKAKDEADFGEVVTEEDTGETEDEEETVQANWDDISGDAQNEAEMKFKNEAYENGVDVDTSSLDKDTKEETNRDEHNAVVEKADAETVAQFENTFPRDPTLFDAGLGDRHLDPATLIAEENEGEGSHLVNEQTDKGVTTGYSLPKDEPYEDLRMKFTDGTPLTEEEASRVRDAWQKNYDKHMDEAVQEAYESNGYYEARNELEQDAVNSEWNHMSDSAKMDYVSEDEKWTTTTVQNAITKETVTPIEAGLPDKWTVEATDTSDLNYVRTRAVATELVTLRTAELLKERNISGSINPESQVWQPWKSSSTSMGGKALQLAAAEELHGAHRFTPEEVEEIVANSNQPALRAYVRAQWEVNQYLLEKTGMNELSIYRGLMIPREEVAATRVEKVPNPKSTNEHDPEHEFKQLPDIELERNGAASTTLTPAVANNWMGVGLDPTKKYDRVVVRLKVPRTSIISLPVFGHNLKNEKEVVLAGTRNHWIWDAWKDRAPELAQIPIK